ncbi:MAG: YmdB family metallophosphoesterase [Candidatus Saccharibacteria bacterium]|nr:YmdB family metallophosphoesterase [Candidatus Saccharibacteria bacterium]
MNILYIGDIMADAGIEAVEKVLPGLRKQHQFDLVIAQAENVTNGRGITLLDFNRLQKAGVDFFTGGNHIFDNDSIFPELSDPARPIVRPANYPVGTPGLGHKYIDTPAGKVLVVSLLGQIVGKQAAHALDNPLKVIDSILQSQKDVERAATVVNFHGDYSSEKVIIGHYLDGRATAVIGDHWHIPTADARVLPGGTAHITDVGMCGALDSSLGVTYDSVVSRWRDGTQTRNMMETSGARQFNAVLIETTDTGLAKSITPIRQIL